MPPVDLAELRRLHEAATQGDWEVTRFMNIVTTPAPEDGGDIVTESPNRYVLTSFEKWQANAKFIAAAHNDLPALLDELEAAREAVRRLQEVVTAPTYREALALLAGKDARDRHTKLIGAAEKLEQLSGKFGGQFVGTRRYNTDELLEIAAQLRREAEDANRNLTVC